MRTYRPKKVRPTKEELAEMEKQKAIPPTPEELEMMRKFWDAVAADNFS